MPIQIGRFSFRGPFPNLDEIKDRPGIFIIHNGDIETNPLTIKENPLLKSSITEKLRELDVELGQENNCFVSVYNTFCTLTLDRQEMVDEIKSLFKVEK